MKANRIWTVLLALALVFDGCVREPFTSDREGTIRFNVNQKRVSTRTAYSGIVDGSGKELVNWESGDLIRILSEQVSSPASGYADYILEPESRKTSASAEAATPGSGALAWGTGQHVFYSMYPAPSASGAQEGISLTTNEGTGVITAVLPQDQSSSTVRGTAAGSYYGNMLLSYMASAASASAGQAVTLSFKPIVTTFYVSVKNTTLSPMHLTSVRLSSSSSPLCGTFRANVASDNSHTFTYKAANSSYVGIGNYSHTDENSSIFASFSGSGHLLSPGDTLTVALFAIPEDISSLTLTVTSTEEGSVSLGLKDSSDNWLSFTGGHKHNLNNIGLPEISYTLSVTPSVLSYDYLGTYSDQEFTVESYRQVGSSSIRQEPWKTQVYYNNAWTDLSDVVSIDEFSWLSSFPLTSQSSPDGSSSTTKSYRRAVGARSVTSHEDRLRSGAVLSADGESPVTHNTSATAIDLSYYNFVTKRMESSRYTANTYVISAPGYYKIPLVFGNAIENGSAVADTYTGSNGLGHINDFICPFPNALGTESSIHLVTTRPWLNSARSQSARVQWEKWTSWDSNTDQPVTAHRGYSDAAGVTVIDDLSIVSGSGNERYLVFRVSENNIRPGNAVLSSLDNNGNVMWSWQIWITDQTMSPTAINNGSADYSVLPVNTGWTDLSKGQYFAPREALIRFANTQKAGVYSSTLTVRQREAELPSTVGWSCYYQWGRKDPMPEGPTVVYDNDGYLHESIKRPEYIMYDRSSYFGDRYYDWTVNNYNNLWDSKNNSWATPGASLPNCKTVYDPSPRRFCVAPDEAWDGFASYGYSAASAQGVWFYTNSGRSSSVYFPAAGYMDYLTAAVVDDGPSGYWTYHPGENVQRRSSYNLKFQYIEGSGSVSVNCKTLDGADRAYGMSVRSVAYN